MMTFSLVASIFISAAAVAWAATLAVIPMMRSRGQVDVPNARSSHDRSIPRGGGIGLLMGVLAACMVLLIAGRPLPGWPFLTASGLVALCGYLDDRLHGLPVAVRLSVHLSAAAVVLGTSGGLPTLPFPEPMNLPAGAVGLPLGILWIVGVTNLYNFLDGIDGLAALQGIIAGCGLALIAPGPAGMMGVALAGACLGFLVHNWHPARIFMGDVGSTTIGFMLAAAPFELAPEQRPDAVFAVAILLWFFLADGTFTLFRRVLNREKIWQPHRSHLYQRLVVTGLQHDEVTLLVHAATAFLAVLTVASLTIQSAAADWLVLAVASGAFLAYTYFTMRRERAVFMNSGV